ncbi:MAG: neutral/alkaline non-lysosomal ceramidase N-terminal domain-containing protein [Bacteroidales bacterium]|nr:neutral/alkaline non-lysosomal ceramidase N-terminal domain-containing protein [Bacteroidales bacterium]
MKKKLAFGVLIMLISFTTGISFTQNPVNEKNLIKMGVSQINITPEKPTVMGGYGFRVTPFTGVHDDLYASALFFSGEKTKTLLITADLLGFQTYFIDDVKKSITSATGIPSDNIMISAVHNHGGPGTRMYDTDTMRTVEAYLKVLKEKLTSLAIDATKDPVPVRIGIGKGSCNMNVNRRAEFPGGIVGLGRNPDGACDHELVVVKFEDMNNKTLAVLVNWPCHGTVSGPKNYQITGDWPGAAARYIKNHVEKDVVVAMTAGASANINPIYGPGNDFKEIEAVGYHVGVEALKTLSQTTTYPVKTLQATSETVIFPGKKVCSDELAHATYESGPDATVSFTVQKIGDLVISGISGELMTEMGMEVKKLSPYSGTIIVTHCNGTSGYLCTDKAFTEGGYEVSVTKLMPGAEKKIVNKFEELIHSF